MKNRMVLLFSGGMDSLIAAHFHPQALKLYVATGSRYEDKEIAYLSEEYNPGEITFDRRLNLSDVEREDAIVPARNVFLTTIAALYGSEIILAAVKGDKSTDKDDRFELLQTALLRHVFSPPHFTDYSPTIHLPMRSRSKGGWVREYLDCSGSREKLARSVSCYHPTERYCGECKACLRKWVAQEFSGVTGTPWVKHPGAYNWYPLMHAIEARKWRCIEEDEQTEAVLRMHGVW